MINTADLRALADFLDAHPDLAEHGYLYSIVNVPCKVSDWSDRRRLLGSYDKRSDDNHLIASRSFGAAHIDVYVPREDTCERVQVGETVVERTVYPDDVQPMIETVTEPVYEWVCPESWLAAS